MNDMKNSSDGALTQYSTGSAPVAYFSMEIGLDVAGPTYSGGLGILAGDALGGAAVLGTPNAGCNSAVPPRLFETKPGRGWQSARISRDLASRGASGSSQPARRTTIEGRRVLLVRAWLI